MLQILLVGRARVGASALVLCGCALSLWCVPAFSLPQRGHEFELSFGSSGDDALSEPGAIAVSDVGASRGDVYVLDRGHDRIVEYGPRGEFISVWGWGVKNGEAQYETCTAGCRSGVEGRGEYQFNEYVMGIAVDNCTATKADGEAEAESNGEPKPCPGDPSVGDVYVLAEYADKHEENVLQKEEEAKNGEHEDSEYAAIDKFSAGGTAIEEIAKKIPYEGRETNSKGKPVPSPEELTTENAHGVAVGASGTVWVYDEEELYPLSDATLNEPGASQKPRRPGEWERPLSLEIEGVAAPGLAAGPQGDFYVGELDGSTTLISKQQFVYNEAGEREENAADAIVGLDDEDSTAVAAGQLDVPSNAVDEQDDAYITNMKSEKGTRVAAVAQFSSGGQLLQRFGGGAPGLSEGFKEGAGVAVNSETGDVYVADSASNDIDLFVLEAPRAPSVERRLGARRRLGNRAA